MSNNWKSTGGINRRSKNNIVNSNNQVSSNFIPSNNIGLKNVNIESASNIAIDSGNYLGSITNEKNYNNLIAYYPFNQNEIFQEIKNDTKNNAMSFSSKYDLENYK